MILEKTVVGVVTGYPLNGLLTFPDDLSKTVPAVIFVHGSGPSNMDEKIKRLTPFKDLAEGLAARGIASLRYDKRTFAYGRKLTKNKHITVEDETIEDALLAIRQLEADKRVNRKRIFIVGHSMGAMLAPRIDAEGGNVAGLVMMAATPYRIEDVMLRQLRQAGESKSVLGRMANRQYKKYSKRLEGLYQLSDDEAKATKFAGGLSLYYLKEMGQKTAADYLLESYRPALIMQAEKDLQVLAEDDYKEFQRLLAGRVNTTFKLYPNLNHAFVPAHYDNILKASKEFEIAGHIGDDVIDDIAAFIQKPK